MFTVSSVASTGVELYPWKPLHKESEIAYVISRMAPHVSKKNADKYDKLIRKYSELHELDWKIVVAILFQESRFKENAVNCGRYGCNDFGIAQINFRNIKAWGMDFGKIFDAGYSIKHATAFLERLKNRHSHKDPKWFARYNSGTPHLKNKYYKLLRKHLNRIERILNEQEDLKSGGEGIDVLRLPSRPFFSGDSR